MTETVQNGTRSGHVKAPASKSAAHRLLITAALSQEESTVYCDTMSDDIAATMDCLGALGATFEQGDGFIRVSPFKNRPEGMRELRCKESGSTLRFLMPVAAALGASVTFVMEGKLPERPHKALTDELSRHNVSVSQEGSLLKLSGQFTPGDYTLPGDISSQFVSGLLFALPMLPGDSTLTITGKRESVSYITMTEQAVSEAGIVFEKTDWGYRIPGGQCYRAPKETVVEGDWSGAAFMLVAGAFSKQGITVTGLRQDSCQGDRRILSILRDFGAEVVIDETEVLVRRGNLKGQQIDASEIPDLVPVLAILAAGADGETVIVHAERLRMKESDRLKTTTAMLSALSGDITETADGLLIRGGRRLKGGNADSAKDHRIAMSAAVAAGLSDGPVRISDAQCAAKSYPSFFTDYNSLSLEGNTEKGER